MQNTDVKNIDNYAPRGLHFPGTGKYPPAATIGAPFSSSSAACRTSACALPGTLVAQGDLVGLGDVVGLDGPESCAQALAGLP